MYNLDLHCIVLSLSGKANKQEAYAEGVNR